MINKKLNNKDYSLNNLLDSIKNQQLRTVIYIMGYFSSNTKLESLVTSIGRKESNLPIDYLENDFFCTEKSLEDKIEEIDHVKYKIKSPYLFIDLDIDNARGEMYYTTNYDNNVISVPLRTKSTVRDITPILRCSFEGFFEIPSSQYRKNSEYIENNNFPLKNIVWMYAVDDDKIPENKRFCFAFIPLDVDLTPKDPNNYYPKQLNLSQIEILQEDLIKFIIEKNIAKKITNKADNIEEKNKMKELQNLVTQYEKTIEKQKKEIEQLQKESISIKAKKFIKALIYIHYGSDVANSPEAY